MNAIAVVDKNWGLGLGGKLLVHMPGDLRYFKEKTLGKTIVIGRGTFESMSGRPLAGRETVILTKNENYSAPCPVVHSLDEALERFKDIRSEDLFIAGGEAVYKLFFPYCDKFFITKLYKSFAADRYFPDLDGAPGEFEAKAVSGVMEENNVEYQFFEYARIK